MVPAYQPGSIVIPNHFESAHLILYTARQIKSFASGAVQTLFQARCRIEDFKPRSIESGALIFVAEPLGQTIIYIHNPRTIENMARWLEFQRYF